MEQNIGKMMAGRFQAKDLDIHHVREPGQWMPIAGGGGLKRPFNACPGQALLDVSVGGDVVRVIVTYEIVVEGREECPTDQSGEQKGCERGSMSKNEGTAEFQSHKDM